MDPRENDRHIEDAKASLVAHLEELGRRFHDVRHKLDIPAHIEAHPLLATLVAFALGAIVGLAGGRDRGKRDGDGRPGVGSVAVTVLSAIGIRLARDVAAHYLSDAAKTWLGGDAKQRTASRDPNVEAFLEH